MAADDGGRPPGGGDLLEGRKIVGLVVGGCVLYGVLHDQVTVRICLEYFTVFHPHVVDSRDPTVLALVWGVGATWWVGVLLLCVAGAAVLAGIAGRILGASGAVIVVPPWTERIPASEHVDFLTALWMHGGSYLAGFVGGVVLAVRTWRRRNRAQAA